MANIDVNVINASTFEIVYTDNQGNVLTQSMTQFDATLDNDAALLIIRNPFGATWISFTNQQAVLVTNVDGSPVTINNVTELYNEIAAVIPASGGGAGIQNPLTSNLDADGFKILGLEDPTGSDNDEVVNYGFLVTAINSAISALMAKGQNLNDVSDKGDARVNLLATAVSGNKAAYDAATKKYGTLYTITNPQGSATNPITIFYSGVNRAAYEGFIFITTINKYYPILYNPGSDKIIAIYDPEYNIYARQRIGGNVYTPPDHATVQQPVNCVDYVISVMEVGANGVNVYNLDLNNCRIDGFDPANNAMYDVVMQSESWLTLGTTDYVFPYSFELQRGAKMVIGDGSEIKWGLYYSWSFITFGVNSFLDDTRIYDGAIVTLPDTVTYTHKEYKKESSTFDASIDIGADTTPDLSTVAYAGKRTITCTAASISITDISGNTGGFRYRDYIATGKTITYVDGATMILKGGIAFVGIGSNGDWIEYETSADGTVLREINRANY